MMEAGKSQVFLSILLPVSLEKSSAIFCLFSGVSRFPLSSRSVKLLREQDFLCRLETCAVPLPKSSDPLAAEILSSPSPLSPPHTGSTYISAWWSDSSTQDATSQ